MRVDAIQNGVVIDHIAPGGGMRLYELLELDKLSCPVAIMKNVPSGKMGKKDIIKIDGELSLNLDLVGYVAPQATVNVIRDGRVQQKQTPRLPEKLVNVLRCKNPRCITSTEQELDQVFRLTDRKNQVYRCLYCETQAK